MDFYNEEGDFVEIKEEGLHEASCLRQGLPPGDDIVYGFYNTIGDFYGIGEFIGNRFTVSEELFSSAAEDAAIDTLEVILEVLFVEFRMMFIVNPSIYYEDQQFEVPPVEAENLDFQDYEDSNEENYDGNNDSFAENKDNFDEDFEYSEVDYM